jgi:GAF domain-containing protein
VLIEEMPKKAPPPPPRMYMTVSAPPEVRLPAEEMLAILFDRLHALELVADALDGARLLLEVIALVLPCRASLVHFFDVERKEFIVVDARGTQADTMKLARHGASDPLLRMAMPTGKPFVWPDLRYAPVNRLTRFKAIDNVRCMLTCPVVSGARWYGAIELVDPLGGGGFRSEHENAMRYVSDRYASFLTRHGVITDVETVARFAFSA